MSKTCLISHHNQKDRKGCFKMHPFRGRGSRFQSSAPHFPPRNNGESFRGRGSRFQSSAAPHFPPRDNGERRPLGAAGNNDRGRGSRGRGDGRGGARHFGGSRDNLNDMPYRENEGREPSRDRHTDHTQNRNGGNSRDSAPRVMTYGRLKKWAAMTDSAELILFMVSEKQQLENFLNQSQIKPDWMSLLVQVVSFAITARHQMGSVKYLLGILCNTRFFEHFSTYIEEKQIMGLMWSEAEEFYESLIRIMEEILDCLPQHAIKCFKGSNQLSNSLPSIQNIRDNIGLLDKINATTLRAKTIYHAEKEKEKKPKSGTFLGSSESDKPPDNICDLPVLPLVSDLDENAKPFVRSVKFKGEYADVEDYLDIQFRLMRQDFIYPLRAGIVDFKKNGCKRNYTSSDLRLYFDVHIVEMVFEGGIDHILQFDVSKLRNVKWEMSKRLIFGSLLCLSKDNFETVLFATVVHRDAKNLTKGIINVNFKSGLDEVFKSTASDVYVMAETTAYYESYRHVLEGLQEMSKTLPLQDYIIKCKKELKPPRYLLGTHSVPQYDVSCLMKNEEPKTVSVLTTTRWPGSEAMCLNDSQRQAAMQALTKELAIIQGPPGTGKTYVGLKVMQVLVSNMDLISNNEEGGARPILVVCYTNHALDQFLEGVLQFCPDGIVRVGGKNNSEKLEPFNIKNLRQKARKEKLFTNLSVRRAKYECLKELETISESIKGIHKTFNKMDTDILPEKDLINVMKGDHCDSLMSQRIPKNTIRTWLNVSNSTPESLIPEMIKRHLTKLVLQWKEETFNLNLTADMDICQRASFYNSYLSIYKSNLLQWRQNVLLQFNFGGQANVAIDERLAASDRIILPDSDLEEVLPEAVIAQMYHILQQHNRRAQINEGTVVQTWLLGLHRDLNSQLDDVQRLTELISGGVNPEAFDDDDASKQAQNDRIIDDDDDNDFDEGGKNYLAKNKDAMNSMSFVMQRADLLGIKEELLEGEVIADKDDWKQVRHAKPLSFYKIQKKLKSIPPMTETVAERITDVWGLEPNQRFALYNLWVKKHKEDLVEDLHKLVIQYTAASDRKREADAEDTLFLLRSAKVIGMTTTGAAKNRAVLQALGCRIVVVEEAAEVLESHIVTALNKDCKHLVLIGDHQQLRPNPTVFLLAKEYGLEISLFERLINNSVPHIMLKEQHRMRPEISKIMRHIYPHLKDHISVKLYDDIRGVSKNLFFIQHNNRESYVDDSRSKSNIHEAEFLVALCQYLLNQGYDPSEITILATYAGQVFAIKKRMRDIKFNHRVRVTAVDNFQGEENNIILLSLVRSNTENNVGFLKVDNRVCVALSRAKKGLYVAGNFDLLASQSKLWKNITEEVKIDEMIGEGLPIKCQNHSDFQMTMTCAEDFDKCPDGGCGRPCEFRLDCGHVCGRKCHGYDLEHKDFQCRKACAKECENGHKCLRKCFQDCGKCMIKMTKKILTCGHEDEVPCSVLPTAAECSQKCGHLLPCEHFCSGKCGQCRKTGKHQQCLVTVTYSWPCGHKADVSCYMKPTDYPCQKMCGAELACGHTCIGKCSDCLEGAVHVACSKKCDKLLPCGHKCDSYCGVPCLPCTMVCPGQCRHGSCEHSKPKPQCSHFCPPCKEPCKTMCIHNKCKKLCSEKCDIEICQLRCQRKLNCGHRCSGLCGELCVCDTCDKVIVLVKYSQQGKDLLKDVSDNNETVRAKHDFTGEPNIESKNEKKRLVIKIPSCNHVFYVDEMDRYIEDFDPSGCSYITCPSCPKGKPISKCMRYEDFNRARAPKREEEKTKLKLATEVSKKQQNNLLASQKCLEDSAVLSGFLHMNVTEVKDVVELQAVSFKLKCAFMLGEILSLQEAAVSSASLVKTRKDIVLKIPNRLTEQLRSEMTTELLRYFWLSYLIHLEDLASQHDIILSENLKNNIIETKYDLNMLRPSKVVLDRALHVAGILRRRIKEIAVQETAKAKCLLLEEAATRAIKVMQSSNEEMLCDLVGSGPNTEAVTGHDALGRMFAMLNIPKTSSSASGVSNEKVLQWLGKEELMLRIAAQRASRAKTPVETRVLPTADISSVLVPTAAQRARRAKTPVGTRVLPTTDSLTARVMAPTLSSAVDRQLREKPSPRTRNSLAQQSLNENSKIAFLNSEYNSRSPWMFQRAHHQDEFSSSSNSDSDL